MIPKYSSNFFLFFTANFSQTKKHTVFSFYFNVTTKIIPVNISSHNASDTLSSWFWFRKWSVKKFTISSKLTSSISQPVSTFFRRIWLSRSWTLCKKKKLQTTKYWHLYIGHIFILTLHIWPANKKKCKEREVLMIHTYV